jgi:mRNA-degrading endonuclease RelE of RelBE toxin-antitoxin system
MNYSVIAVPNFKKEAKKLSKKYPSLKDELSDLLESLAKNPIQGIPLGNNCFKIRIAIHSKKKGKSGGARIITNIVVRETTVYLLSMYDKNEKDTISIKELSKLLNSVPT